MVQARHWAGISLAAGAGAAAICGAWLRLSWDHGIRVPPPLPEDLMEFDTLQATVAVGAVFLIAVPLLTAVSVVAGIRGGRQAAARAGLVFAGAAALCYVAFLRACIRALPGA